MRCEKPINPNNVAPLPEITQGSFGWFSVSAMGRTLDESGEGFRFVLLADYRYGMVKTLLWPQSCAL